ncbi:MAG: hypothetical protein CVU87_06305 [Firmicutes bacterium HGW-Firmicutes-12]|nr:MAG: hypothetical protein CVU87_06305 [Firmicutes bacterium HGW-Firmicutes-12]
MKKNENKKRTLLGIFFLLLLIVLWLTGLIKVWMIIMILAIAVTPLWGRLYCGFICPVATSLNLASLLLDKKRNKNKIGLNSKWVKYLALLIFIAGFVAINKTQFFVPVFILLIPLAFIVVFLFGEAFWHRICPFGTIFGFLARFSKYRYDFLSQTCSRCGLCEKNCKAACLTVGDTLNIDAQECLYCGKCEQVCPENNIIYGKQKA